MQKDNLEKLAEVDIQTIEKDGLVEIKEVEIDPGLERAERISSFVQQIKNPYCFLCDGVIVKIRFTKTEASLEEKLNAYFRSL